MVFAYLLNLFVASDSTFHVQLWPNARFIRQKSESKDRKNSEEIAYYLRVIFKVPSYHGLDIVVREFKPRVNLDIGILW